MLGMVFTEFLEMIEQRYSPELADQILTETQLANDGAYTAVGYYPHEEMLALVTALSRHTGSSVAELVQAYGEHLFQRFVALYPQMFQDRDDAFSLLARVDGQIHQEVRKLYPQAQLPSFEIAEHTERRLVLIYRSSRPLADLAEGLIRACIQHYRQPLQLQREDLPAEAGGSAARFELFRP
ncbi:MAG: heme NO-binding domain-containing protein [Pseudomonas sp.]